MHRIALLSFLFGWCIYSSAMAQEKAGDTTSESRIQGLLGISPIFSQLVALSSPKGFKPVPVFENISPDGKRYIREAVLDGETVNQWSQMITVTGAKGLAADPNLTPQAFAESIVGGFKRVCPDSFSAKALGATKISGQDAFVALAGCGSVQSGAGRHSEAVLLISIKGSADYYTIQWAERGVEMNSPVALDEPKWTDRLKQLNPIRICARIPGEPAPYPSCVNRK
jgi:hypothetical protein